MNFWKTLWEGTGSINDKVQKTDAKTDEKTYYTHGAQQLARSVASFSIDSMREVSEIWEREKISVRKAELIFEYIFFYLSIIQFEYLEAKLGREYGELVNNEIKNELVTLLYKKNWNTGNYYLDNFLVDYRNYLPLKKEEQFTKRYKERFQLYWKLQIEDDKNDENNLGYAFLQLIVKKTIGNQYLDKKYSHLSIAMQYILADSINRLIEREKELIEQYYT